MPKYDKIEISTAKYLSKQAGISVKLVNGIKCLNIGSDLVISKEILFNQKVIELIEKLIRLNKLKAIENAK
jgi:hypothetical protein